MRKPDLLKESQTPPRPTDIGIQTQDLFRLELMSLLSLYVTQNAILTEAVKIPTGPFQNPAKDLF